MDDCDFWRDDSPVIFLGYRNMAWLLGRRLHTWAMVYKIKTVCGEWRWYMVYHDGYRSMMSESPIPVDQVARPTDW